MMVRKEGLASTPRISSVSCRFTLKRYEYSGLTPAPDAARLPDHPEMESNTAICVLFLIWFPLSALSLPNSWFRFAESVIIRLNETQFQPGLKGMSCDTLSSA